MLSGNPRNSDATKDLKGGEGAATGASLSSSRGSSLCWRKGKGGHFGEGRPFTTRIRVLQRFSGAPELCHGPNGQHNSTVCRLSTLSTSFSRTAPSILQPPAVAVNRSRARASVARTSTLLAQALRTHVHPGHSARTSDFLKRLLGVADIRTRLGETAQGRVADHREDGNLRGVRIGVREERRRLVPVDQLPSGLPLHECRRGAI
jgi:hypothetical protein